MTTRAEWGPGKRPPPSEPKAAPVALLFGAFALVVCGLVFAAAVASTIGMAVVGEPHEGDDLWLVVIFGGLEAVVLAIGWRAYRRDDPGAGAGAAILARLAPVLAGAGLLLGIAAGVWMTVVELDATISIDRRACARFTGPLEPTDREACRSVARDCRHEVRSKPAPPLPRGVPVGADGVDWPFTAQERAVSTCMLERRAEFVR